MKTFCVVQGDGKTYLVKAVDVFEVSQADYVSHGIALTAAMSDKRPLSTIEGSWRHTRFADRLPISVAGLSFVKVKPHAEL